MAQLLQLNWIRQHRNLLIEGPTGTAKTFLACAFGQSACEHGISVRYFRASRLFESLTIAHGDGSFGRILAQLAKSEFLIIDDWGLDKLSTQQRYDLLEVMEDRHGRGVTLIASQLPIAQWHELIGDPTLADAILDRLVHNATKIKMKGNRCEKSRQNLSKHGHLSLNSTNLINTARISNFSDPMIYFPKKQPLNQTVLNALFTWSVSPTEQTPA